jgi:lactate dehydrogenase-like 2-hydroxyacid dehydrogenase
VVDEVAIVDALKNKKIRGFATDVYEMEPTLAEGLKELPNVVLTPHIASATEEARNAMSVQVAENLIEFFAGREPKYLVN